MDQFYDLQSQGARAREKLGPFHRDVIVAVRPGCIIFVVDLLQPGQLLLNLGFVE